MAYLEILNFFGIALDLRPKEVINPFQDIPKLSFDSEDVILILSIMSNLNEMSKLTYLYLLGEVKNGRNG